MAIVRRERRAVQRPGVRERARLAWRVFQKGVPRPVEVKQAPFVWPAWRQGQPQWHLTDFETYVTEGFYRNPLIYRAVMYKIYAKWLAPLRAYGGEKDNPEPLDDDHPLAALVKRPNKYQSAMEFESLNMAYANLSGNCYIYLQRPKVGRGEAEMLPEEMYTLRPDRVSVVPDPRNERGLLGYWYTPEGRSERDGIPMRYQDVIHVKYPNPGDPLEGLGEGFPPTGAGGMSADVDNEATSFLKDFFERGLMPNVVLEYDEPLDEWQIDEVRARWREIYGGREAWLDPAVLGSGGSVNRLGMTFEELGFGTLDERNETRILGPFGVPAVLIGARVGLQNATYSNVEGLRRLFWEDVFVPELMLFETDYQYSLRTEDGAFVAYDTSGVPALQEDTPAQVEAAYKMWQMGTPANMAFRSVGLSVEPVPDGDVGYVSSTVIPIGMAGMVSPEPDVGGDAEQVAEEEPAEEMPVEDEEEEEQGAKFWQARAVAAKRNGRESADPKASRGWSPDQKAAIWQGIDRTAAKWEGEFADAVEAVMRREQRELLALLSKEKSMALKGRRMIGWDNVLMDWEQFYVNRAPEFWREALTPLLRGLALDQRDHWMAVLERSDVVLRLPQQIMEWVAERREEKQDPELDALEQWLLEYAGILSQPVIETTRAEIYRIIAQAQNEGWSIPEMERQLELSFDRFLDPDFDIDGYPLSEAEKEWFRERLPRYRRELISRTESMRWSNMFSHWLFKRWGVRRKEWLTAIDGRERDSHRDANGQQRPMDEPFIVGSGAKLMHPHDMSLGAGLDDVANCRCVALPIVEV